MSNGKGIHRHMWVTNKFPLSHCIIEECSPPKDVHIPLDTQSMWICNMVRGN